MAGGLLINAKPPAILTNPTENIHGMGFGVAYQFKVCRKRGMGLILQWSRLRYRRYLYGLIREEQPGQLIPKLVGSATSQATRPTAGFQADTPDHHPFVFAFACFENIFR